MLWFYKRWSAVWNLGGRERERWGLRRQGGGRGMAGPLLQMRGSRHRLPLLKRPSLLLSYFSPLRRIEYQVCIEKLEEGSESTCNGPGQFENKTISRRPMANADVQKMTKNNEVEYGRSQSARSKMMLQHSETFCDVFLNIKPKNFKNTTHLTHNLTLTQM